MQVCRNVNPQILKMTQSQQNTNTKQAQYAMDYVFSVATRMMYEKDVIPKKVEDLQYLQSLNACLNSATGREYLFRFLQQSVFSIFFKSVFKCRYIISMYI